MRKSSKTSYFMGRAVRQRVALNRQRLLTVQEREEQRRERELQLLRTAQITNPQAKATE